MTPRDMLLALAVTVIWGTNFVAIKWAVADMPPLLVTSLRFFFTALPMVFFLPKPRVSWLILGGFGFLLGVVKFGLLFSAINLGMPAGLASLVAQLQVFFTVGFAVFLFGERPTAMQMLGGAVAFAGIAVLAAGKGGGAPLVPFLMTIGVAFVWGAANIVVKKAGRVDVLAFMVWSSLIPPLPLLALSLLIEGPQAVAASLAAPGWRAVLSLLYIVGPSTLFGFAAWNSLLSRHPVAEVAPFALLIPVFGLLSGVLVLGEPFGPAAALGSAIVFLGLVINVFGGAFLRRFRAAS